MEKTTSKENGGITIFSILFKHIPFIIIFTVIVGLLSFGLGYLRVKPTYTASRSVILSASVGAEVQSDAQSKNDTSLAKRILSNVFTCITGERVEQFANECYKGEGYVDRYSVWFTNSEDSFVFTISYTDLNKNVVQDKLDAVIEGFNNFIASDNYDNKIIMADDIELISTQNRPSSLVMSRNYTRYILWGLAIGLAGAIAIVVIRNALDMTIKSKEELETITGASVLTYINKYEK